MPDKNLDTRLILAPLELQIALLARAGLTRWEIAAALGLQQGTVKSQLERVAAKLGSNWKNKDSILWPELEEEVRLAVRALQARHNGLPGDRNQDRDENIDTGSVTSGREIAPTICGQGIGFKAARQALEGEISSAEAAILQLQGLSSPAGTAFLRQARATQWQLLLLGESRILYTNAAARFWLKPALAVLNDNRYIHFFHSDSEDELYRPWWLPYTTNGRARGTRAAYFKLGDASGGEYVRSFLDAWIDTELEEYAARLHARMQQRWQALCRIARASGRPQPPAPPGYEELMAEAREALGM